MQRIVGFVVVLLLGISVSVIAQPLQPENAVPVPYVPTAKEAVHSAMHSLGSALNRTTLSQLQWAASNVIGAKQDNPLLEEVGKELGKRRGNSQYSLSEIEVDIKGDDAVATFNLTLRDSLGGRITQTEELSLKRVNTPDGPDWKVLPGEPDKVVKDTNSGYLLHLATLLAHPREMLSLSRAEVSSSNLKQLALGIFMLTQDYDEQYAIDNVEFKEKLLPYTAGEQIFYSPADKSGEVSYSLNDNLSGLKVHKITQLESTVLLYEGQGGELSFRHDGRALVGLTNGIVKFVTPEEAKTLHWEP